METSDSTSVAPEENDSGTAAVELAEREDLERRLRAAGKKRARHNLWLVLGISPAAAIPAMGLLAEGEIVLLVVLLVLVFVAQLYGLVKASREVRRLEQELEALSQPTSPSSPPVPAPESGGV